MGRTVAGQISCLLGRGVEKELALRDRRGMEMLCMLALLVSNTQDALPWQSLSVNHVSAEPLEHWKH